MNKYVAKEKWINAKRKKVKLSDADLWRAQVLLGADRSEGGWGIKYICEEILKTLPDRSYSRRILERGDTPTERRKLIRAFLGEHGATYNGVTYGKITPRGDATHYVYFVKQQSANMFKIGMSCDVEKRVKALQVSNPHKLIIVGSIIAGSRDQAFFIEHAIHKKLKKYRVSGEWFECDYRIISSMLRAISNKK